MKPTSANFYEFGKFRLDAEKRVLLNGDNSVVEITPKALEILCLLVENAGQVVSKEEIFQKVWSDSFVEEANLSHHIFRLRKALGETEECKFIETVPKRGYRFVTEVKEAKNPIPPLRTVNRSSVNQTPLVAGIPVLLLVLAVFLIYRLSRENRQPTPSNNSIESIAVMPFQNESGNSEIDYLSDGMTESLISSLSNLPKIKVKARSSVFHYKGKEVSPHLIGNELNVQAIVNGRMVQHGDDLTLYLSLIDTNTENQIWGGQYTRKLSKLIDLQTEIAQDVSEKLRLKLSGPDEQSLSKKYTTNPEAYQLYLKGRYYWNKRTIGDLRKSLDFFNQAIEKDPSYALAYAGLADAYALIPAYSSMDLPQDFLPKARAAALKALEMDETLAEAHTTLANIKANYDWNFPEAEKEFKRALEINPNYATAHQWYAEYLLAVGRREDALAEIKRAQEIDPLSLIINALLGLIDSVTGQDEQAVEQLKKTIEMDPNFPRTHLFLAETLENQGKFEEATMEFERHAVLLGTPPDEAAKDWSQVRGAYKTGGVEAYLRKQLEIFERGRAQKLKIAPPPDVIAGIYARLGEKEKALNLLEQSFNQRDTTLYRLRTRVFAPLRDDPRFQDLLRRLGVDQ